MLEVDSAAAGSVPPCRNASKQKGNTCSQDITFFGEARAQQKASPSHLGSWLLCTKRTLLSRTSLQLKLWPWLSGTSCPSRSITRRPVEGTLSRWNSGCPEAPAASHTPSKDRSKGCTPPMPTLRVLLTREIRGCLLAEGKERRSVTAGITTGCAGIMPVTTVFWVPCSFLTQVD